MKYMNNRLRKAIRIAFESENTNASNWTAGKSISTVQISTLTTRGLRPEALKELCKESNWKYPQTSVQICIACINDFIEEKLGRKHSEFSIKQAEKKANIEFEKNLELLENFARSSEGAVQLIATLASIIRGELPSDKIESLERAKAKAKRQRKENA